MTMLLKVNEKDHAQDVVLLLENGKQLAATVNCFVVNNSKAGKMNKIQFARTVSDKSVNEYRLLRYSEKQDVLFYKKVMK